MSLSTWFGWKVGGNTPTDEFPDIFPLSIKRDDFIKTDIINIYAKILTDVVERVSGLTDEQTELLWDNCLKSGSADGLITLLAKAMADKKDLFLVYERGAEVIREATTSEQAQIKADYAKEAQSKVGVFISFKNYVRSDMVKLYSGLEYCTVSALNKQMNLSKAIQLKLSDLRGSVSLIDSADVRLQAAAIAKGLGEGKDILLDAKDSIATSNPDLTAVKEAIVFIESKLSFYLGMPESYINGVQTGGLGTTGENDTKAIERGLRSYFFSIIRPVLDAIFATKVKYKSQDFRQIGQALETIKTFELVSDELITFDEKKRIVASLLDLEPDEKPKAKVAAARLGPARELTSPLERDA